MFLDMEKLEVKAIRRGEFKVTRFALIIISSCSDYFLHSLSSRLFILDDCVIPNHHILRKQRGARGKNERKKGRTHKVRLNQGDIINFKMY